METINVFDEMETAISMLAFMNTSLMAIHDESGTKNLSDREILGLQNILFNIEAKLEGVLGYMVGNPRTPEPL